MALDGDEDHDDQTRSKAMLETAFQSDAFERVPKRGPNRTAVWFHGVYSCEWCLFLWMDLDTSIMDQNQMNMKPWRRMRCFIISRHQQFLPNEVIKAHVCLDPLAVSESWRLNCTINLNHALTVQQTTGPSRNELASSSYYLFVVVSVSLSENKDSLVPCKLNSLWGRWPVNWVLPTGTRLLESVGIYEESLGLGKIRKLTHHIKW